MSKNYYGGSKHTGLKVFAWIVTILLIAAIVAGVWYVARTTDNFTSNPFADDDEILPDEGDSFIFSGDDEDNQNDESAISIVSFKIDPSEYEDYGIDLYSVETAYTLILSINSDATVYDFSWESDDFSGMISLSPTSDGLSCTVSCAGAFDTQVTVTATEFISGLSASCKFDYVKRPVTEGSALSYYCNSGSVSVKNGNNVLFTSNDFLFPSSYTFGSQYMHVYFDDFSTSDIACMTLSDLDSAHESDYMDSEWVFNPSLGTGTVEEDWTFSEFSMSLSYLPYSPLDYCLSYPCWDYMSTASYGSCAAFGHLISFWEYSWTLSNDGSVTSYSQLQGYKNDVYACHSRVDWSGDSLMYGWGSSSYVYVGMISFRGSITGVSYSSFFAFQPDCSALGTSVNNVVMSDSSLYF